MGCIVLSNTCSVLIILVSVLNVIERNDEGQQQQILTTLDQALNILRAILDRLSNT